MRKLIDQLKKRRIWRVLVAYPSVVFVLLQAVEFFVEHYGLDSRALTASLVASVVWFPAAILWNWRHGEQGSQPFTRLEISAYGVMTVAALVAASWSWTSAPTKQRALTHNTEPARSVAVMPFANSSEDSEVQYLCDGIAESLINWLATVPDIKVVSKGASFRLRESMHDTAMLAEQLDVDSIITGELERVGDTLVVSVRMVDARDQSQIWGARLQQPSDDVMYLERSIVAAIQDGLRLNIAEEVVLAGGTDNPEAYKKYLQGHYLIQSTELDSIEQGINELRAAIRIDPRFAMPYADIADSYSQLLSYGLLDNEELIGEARNAAFTAIALAPDLVEAHSALAMIHQYYDFDWAAADAAYEAGVALGPTRPGIFHRYTDYLVLMLRFTKAKEMAARAVALDPLDSNSLHAVGLANLADREFDAASETLGDWTRFHPGSRWSYIKHALALSLAGRCEEASAQAAKVAARLGDNTPSLHASWLAWGYHLCGNQQEYRRYVDRVHELQGEQPDPTDPGLIYILALEGDVDGFMQSFLQIKEQGKPFLAFAQLFSVDYIGLPITAKLAEDERYQALLDELDFPQGELD